MSVQPNEALREARERVAELEREVEKLRSRSPRTSIPGVRCDCIRLSNGSVKSLLYMGDIDTIVTVGNAHTKAVELVVPEKRLILWPDEAELLASKIQWGQRAARGEKV